MKKLLILILLCGCTSKTEHGKCIGVNSQENPQFNYEYSGRNIFFSIIFAETIAPPLITWYEMAKCPVGLKK